MTQQSLIIRLKAVEEALENLQAYPACVINGTQSMLRPSAAKEDFDEAEKVLSDLRELIKEAEGQKSAAFQWGEGVVPKIQLKHGEELYTALGEKP